MIPLASIVNRNTFDSQESTETAVDGILSARSTASQEESGNPPPATRASNKSKTENVPAGYPKLAQRMGFVPEMAVFRRFAYLNKLNLLHLQAELVEIESRLKEIQRRDNESPELEQLYAKDWYFLGNSSAEGNNEQLNLLLNAREKLERYNMALIQQSYILPMKKPNKLDLSNIQSFIACDDMGPFGLKGLDSEVWGNIHEPTEYAPDIISLLPRKREDMFSNLITEYGIRKWFDWGLAKSRKPCEVSGLIGYEEGTLLRLTYLTTTALASLLPIVSIVALYSVHSMKARLGIIAAFNVLISFCLAFFTSAKRTDIFAVTAAFAAVQVVFVQGENSSGT